MNILRIALLLTLVAFVTKTNAQESWKPFLPDVTQMFVQSDHEPIDHLEPISGQTKRGDYLAEFSAHPSFSQPYGWHLYRDGHKYILKSWTYLQDEAVTTQTDPDFVNVEVTVEIAKVVYDIWTNALLEVRYSRNSMAGLDGTDYRFSTFVLGLGFLQGGTWSPGDDLPPKWLVECGELIYQYFRASEKDSTKLLTELTAYRQRLYSYWHIHGLNQ